MAGALSCRVGSSSSLYPANVGGNCFTSAYCGLFYLNANNSASNTNANLGSRTLFKKSNPLRG